MNTAIIMDMMFNTEMIVKDMKGGKEDMTEKRFTINFDKRVIVDAKTNAEYGFLVELKTILNELNDENEQLKKENERLLMENRRIKIQW